MSDNIFERIIDISNKHQGILSARDFPNIIKKIKSILIDYELDFDLVNSIVDKLKETMIRSENKNIFRDIIGQIYFDIIDLLGEDFNLIREIKSIKSSINSKLMVLGNNGVGKTSFILKLAVLLKNKGINVAICSLDDHYKLCNQRLWEICQKNKIKTINLDHLNAQSKINYIIENNNLNLDYDIMIIDTKGEDYSNKKNISNINSLIAQIKPEKSIMVIDSFSSQYTISEFSNSLKSLAINSLAVTKYDGLISYGTIISLSKILKKPIEYITYGERIEQIFSFTKDCIINNIIKNIKNNNKQFVLNSINNYKKQLDEKFDLNSLLSFLKSIKEKGLFNKQNNKNEKTTIDLQIIVIFSMTTKERQNIEILDDKRISRISKGCGIESKAVSNIIERISQIVSIINKILDQDRKSKLDDKMKKIISDIIC